MAKAKKTAPKKPRVDKIDEKLVIKGSIADKVVKKNNEDKKKPQKDLEDYPEDDRELGGEG